MSLVILCTCNSPFEKHFGTPTSEEKQAFTRVLQGHIAIDTAIFPCGTTGFMLYVLPPFFNVNLTMFHQRLVGPQGVMEGWSWYVYQPSFRGKMTNLQ